MTRILAETENFADFNPVRSDVSVLVPSPILDFSEPLVKPNHAVPKLTVSPAKPVAGGGDDDNNFGWPESVAT
jgi:hypothetical protein